MRPALLFPAALLATLVALAVACGGSSSETPWPVEPDPAALASPPHLQPVQAGEEDAGARKRKE